MWPQKADDSMDSRQVVVLLVVLLSIADWGHAEGPGGWDGDQIFAEEDTGLHPPPQDAQTPGSLLRSLLQVMQKRPVGSRAFLFQPQRFGRNTWDSWNKKWLSPRAGDGLNSPFWSLAVPQRFGKK
ncbi:pro-FMRFamide-related neuropeptide FF isoform X2 [Rousettus aegyptiacus]|uniref:pro-FMRFamide-related neuropeptide FF isoform X2 n=1 Tax=Rousettus aegyptiacus TaxID=9407 RepID=UPI000786BF52|nr:pro-FMRFamide-related neuropeptide FF isoform X2 [Rousettus aegyptiacus]